MELQFTPEQEAFRAEIREWLAANVPAEPLKNFDTEDGEIRVKSVDPHACSS